MIIGSGNQGLLRPRQEPINCGAVYQTRECSQSSSEVLSDRGHANNHVKITFAQIYEELILFIW